MSNKDNTSFKGRLFKRASNSFQQEIVDKSIKIVLDFVQSRFMTTCTIDPNGWGVEADIAERVLMWYTTTPYAKYSGTFKVSGRYNWDFIERRCDDPKAELRKMVGVGTGRHFFIFKGVAGWLDYGSTSSPSNYSEGSAPLVALSTGQEPAYKITITLLTPKRDMFRELLDEIITVTSKVGAVEKVFLKEFGEGWKTRCELQYRSLDTVYINDEIKTRIIERIESFYNSEKWFKDHGIPYKLVVCLYGPPGNGKTSLVRALAHHFKRNLLNLPIERATDGNLSAALTMAKGDFVLMEDVHSKQVLLRPELLPQDMRGMGSLSLSGYLNAIDGIATLDDVVIFITTNYLERLDPAVTRGGRMDITECIGNLTDPLIRKFIHNMFDGKIDHLAEQVNEFPETSGSNVSSAFAEYVNNPEKFIDIVANAKYDSYAREEVIKEADRKAREERRAEKRQAKEDEDSVNNEPVPDEDA